jgi:hypothetical protein
VAEQMLILDPSGREIGTVVVERPEHQEAVAKLLQAQGFRLAEPEPEPPTLERGGDLEAGECRDDLAEGEVDNCAIAVSVSYAEDFCRRNGITSPKLHGIVARKRLESSAEAREAMAELVGALQQAWGGLSPEQQKEARVYVAYGFPDLAEALPR